MERNEIEKIMKGATAKRDIAATLLSLNKDGFVEPVDDNIYRMTCPKCKARTMEVNTAIQMCRCSCGLSGNVLDVVSSAYETTVLFAADFLSSDFLDTNNIVQRPTNDFYTINKDAARYFYNRLRQKDKDAKNAMLYLTEKRKMSKTTIRDFGLGYAGPGSRDLYKYLKGRYPESLIRESGLISFTSKGIFDKFQDRIMFPIMDYMGRVIGFGGRIMNDKGPKYFNSPESPIFIKGQNLYGITNASKAAKRAMLVCEGYMDTIAMQAAGYKNAVASLGTALSEYHIFTIKRYAETAYFLYDSDLPGIKAALKGIVLAGEAGLTVKTVDLSPHKDPDEFLKSEGKAAFEDRLRTASSSEDFIKKHEDVYKDVLKTLQNRL